MMVHTGYLHGNIKALDYDAKGFTFGLGGVLRFHFGKHFRILQKKSATQACAWIAECSVVVVYHFNFPYHSSSTGSSHSVLFPGLASE